MYKLDACPLRTQILVNCNKIDKKNNYFLPSLTERKIQRPHIALGIQVITWERHKYVVGLD